jgi:hypothetical protein
MKIPMHTVMKNRNVGISFLAGGQNLIPACPYPYRQIYNRQFFEKVKGIADGKKARVVRGARDWNSPIQVS